MKSEKINLNRIFILIWIVLLAISIISMVLSIKPYKKYKEGQDFAITTFMAATDEFNKYKDNRKELLDRMYNYFHGSYISYYQNYSDVRKAKDKVEYTLGTILKEKGYNEFSASGYFKYKNYFEYYKHRISYSTGLYIYIIVCGIVLILNVLYAINRRKEIKINDNMIEFKKFPKKTKQFMIKDITSAETTILKGLKIKGNNIKESALLLKNNEKLKKHIMDLISNNTDTNSSSADELAKYKKLLDSGAITEEEYNKKKEQLLNL